MTNIPANNKPAVKAAVDDLKNDAIPRGSWRLVAALDCDGKFSEKAGYIAFKDKKVVLLYT